MAFRQCRINETGTPWERLPERSPDILGRSILPVSAEACPEIEQRMSTSTDTDPALQDLHLLGAWTLSLAIHLSEHYSIEGQGPPPAGPPNICDKSELTRHLVHIHTLLFRFCPPANP